MEKLKKLFLSFPNLTLHQLFSVIIPLALINFLFDYLSDGEVVKDELKIGIITLVHHIFAFCSVFFGFIFGILMVSSSHTP